MKDIDEFKELLVGEECRRLDGLQNRWDDPRIRARDVAEVLPEALGLGVGEPERLVDALEKPIEVCIQRSVAHDPKTFADALFPVMGPAIRRSISETLKSFVQSINQALEYSLSPRGLKWRFEAWRSGTPFAAVVLKHTLVYRVEAAYLIHNETGLLIDHAIAITHTTLKDEEAVSAMLTAIQDFIQDAFSGTSDSQLESVEIGERTLWVRRGNRATLACLISGLPPQDLRGQLEEVLGDLHRYCTPELAAFVGDKVGLEGIKPLLERCLAFEVKSESASKQIRWWPWVLLALLLLSLLGWDSWRQIQRERALDEIGGRLDAEPGIVLLDRRNGDDRVLMRLLRDPLAAEPRSLVSDSDLAGIIDFDETAIVSLDETLILRRARRQLDVPESLGLELNGGTLSVIGQAPFEWIERVRGGPHYIAGVHELQLPEVEDETAPLEDRVRAALLPPQGVTLTVEGGHVRLGGTADRDWIDSVGDRLNAVDGVDACGFEGMQLSELKEAKALSERIQASRILFSDGAIAIAGTAEVLDQVAADLLWIFGAAKLGGFGVHVAISGQSDGIGNKQWNLWLRRQRADFVANELVRRGLDPARLEVIEDDAFAPSNTPRPGLRRVDFSVRFDPVVLPDCFSERPQSPRLSKSSLQQISCNING